MITDRIVFHSVLLPLPISLHAGPKMSEMGKQNIQAKRTI